MIPFNVQIKDKQKNKDLRKQFQIPGIVYGGKKQYPVFASLTDFKAILSKAGRNNIVELNLEGKKVLSLIKAFQVHPLTDEFIHFDLLEVDSKKEVKIQVPVHVSGTPKGVKEGGLLEIMHEFIEVICFVSSMPSEIKLDVSSLDIGESIHLKDVPVPKNTRFTQDLGSVIVVVTGEVASSTETTEQDAE